MHTKESLGKNNVNNPSHIKQIQNTTSLKPDLVKVTDKHSDNQIKTDNINDEEGNNMKNNKDIKLNGSKINVANILDNNSNYASNKLLEVKNKW